VELESYSKITSKAQLYFWDRTRYDQMASH